VKCACAGDLAITSMVSTIGFFQMRGIKLIRGDLINKSMKREEEI